MLVIKEYSLIENEYGEYVENELVNKYEVNDLALFVYDGCHKIYIVEDMQDIKSVRETWGKDEIFYNIDELPKIWEITCPLRFISNWKLDKQFVRQCYGAKFEWKD